MKSTLTWFLAVTTLTLGLVWSVQSRKAAVQQAEADALRVELERKTQQIEALQAAQERAELQRQETRRLADGLAAQLYARQLAESNVPAAAPTAVKAAPTPPVVAEGDKATDPKNGFGAMLSKMMQDPDTKQIIRSTQRMMVDQLYTPLIKKMGLTPEETTQFKDLLADNMMNAADKATAAMGGLGSTNSAEALSSLSAAQKSFDDQVKAFLGDARFAQYKDYQETSAERMQLNSFKQQSGSDHPLTDLQTEALLTVMKEEKKNVAASTDVTSGDANNAANLQAMLSDEKLNELMQTQETIGQRVYERARTLLSPDQLAAFGQFQTNQMQMTRLGMNMARKMFAPDKSAGAPAPNP
jgi:hypothetical protein